MGVRKNIFSVQTISKWMTTRSLLMLILIVLVIFSLISCQKEKKAEPEKLVNVRVWPAEIRKVQPYLETTGTLKADEEVIVSSEVDGIIRKILVDAGTLVGVGMLLAEINETDYRLDWQRSDAPEPSLFHLSGVLDHQVIFGARRIAFVFGFDHFERDLAGWRLV